MGLKAVFNIFKLTIPLIVGCLFAHAPKAQAQAVGFEKEYATVGYMDKTWGPRQLETSRLILEAIQALTGPGTIETHPWDKYPEKKIQHLSLRTSEGGVWHIHPESVNTGGLDGLEVVTPALRTEAELQAAQDAFLKIKQLKLVMRGLRSSGHGTVEVSHLLKNPQDVSQLVDLILTIENHWADIYQYFRPKRYGTSINRFAVPLAADQQELLQELAELPQNQRSYENVRRVFLKYDELENKLRNEDGKNAGRKWKYRAANYGKLFRLNDMSPLAVIEFRIPDLDFGDKLIEHAHFLKKLVNLKELDKTFKAPFGWRKQSWKEANNTLKSLRHDANFAQELNIKMAPDRETRVTAPDLVDITRPLEKKAEYFTFGFEAEFRGENQRHLINDDESVRRDTFPFLDPASTSEGTGNIEVKSIGGEVHLDEVLEQMEKVKSALKSDLRGFHLRVRVPKGVVQEVGEKSLSAFANALGDYVFAWRLQNRRTFFSLKSETVGRNDIHDVQERGSIRLLPLASGQFDLEIRGFMTDIEMIGKAAQLFMTGLMNPEAINTSYEERFSRTKKFHHLEDFIKMHLPFHSEQGVLLRDLEAAMKGESILPLYRFEDTPGLNEQERVRIRNANLEFAKETMTVVQNVLNKKYESFAEADKQFRWRVKRWALSIDLFSLLEKNLLSDVQALSLRERTRLQELNYQRGTNHLVKKVLHEERFSNSTHRGKILKLLNKETAANILAKIARDIHSPDADTRYMAAVLLEIQTSEEALPLIAKALKSKDTQIREKAIEALTRQKGAKAVPLIAGLLKEVDAAIQSKGLLALKNNSSGEAVALIEKLFKNSAWSHWHERLVSALENKPAEKTAPVFKKILKHDNPRVRREAVDSIFASMTDANSATSLLLLALDDLDWSVQRAALKALAGKGGRKAFPIIQDALKSSDVETRILVAEMLGIQKPGPEALSLSEIAIQDPEVRIRTQALFALGKNPGERALKHIEKSLQSSSTQERLFAVVALENQPAPQALLLFEKMMSDPEAVVRRKAVESLGTRSGSEVLSLLMKAKTSPHSEVRTAAASLYPDVEGRTIRQTILEKGSLDSGRQILMKVRCEAVFN